MKLISTVSFFLFGNLKNLQRHSVLVFVNSTTDFLTAFYGIFLVIRYLQGLVEVNEPIITNPIILLVILGALISFFSIIVNQFTRLKKDLLIVQKQNKELINKLKEK